MTTPEKFIEETATDQKPSLSDENYSKAEDREQHRKCASESQDGGLQSPTETSSAGKDKDKNSVAKPEGDDTDQTGRDNQGTDKGEKPTLCISRTGKLVPDARGRGNSRDERMYINPRGRKVEGERPGEKRSVYNPRATSIERLDRRREESRLEKLTNTSNSDKNTAEKYDVSIGICADDEGDDSGKGSFLERDAGMHGGTRPKEFDGMGSRRERFDWRKRASEFVACAAEGLTRKWWSRTPPPPEPSTERRGPGRGRRGDEECHRPIRTGSHERGRDTSQNMAAGEQPTSGGDVFQKANVEGLCDMDPPEDKEAVHARSLHANTSNEEESLHRLPDKSLVGGQQRPPTDDDRINFQQAKGLGASQDTTNAKEGPQTALGSGEGKRVCQEGERADEGAEKPKGNGGGSSANDPRSAKDNGGAGTAGGEAKITGLVQGLAGDVVKGDTGGKSRHGKSGNEPERGGHEAATRIKEEAQKSGEGGEKQMDHEAGRASKWEPQGGMGRNQSAPSGNGPIKSHTSEQIPKQKGGNQQNTGGNGGNGERALPRATQQAENDRPQHLTSNQTKAHDVGDERSTDTNGSSYCIAKIEERQGDLKQDSSRTLQSAEPPWTSTHGTAQHDKETVAETNREQRRKERRLLDIVRELAAFRATCRAYFDRERESRDFEFVLEFVLEEEPAARRAHDPEAERQDHATVIQYLEGEQRKAEEDWHEHPGMQPAKPSANGTEPGERRLRYGLGLGEGRGTDKGGGGSEDRGRSKNSSPRRGDGLPSRMEHNSTQDATQEGRSNELGELEGNYAVRRSSAADGKPCKRQIAKDSRPEWNRSAAGIHSKEGSNGRTLQPQDGGGKEEGTRAEHVDGVCGLREGIRPSTKEDAMGVTSEVWSTTTPSFDAAEDVLGQHGRDRTGRRNKDNFSLRHE